jgi:hypothetical protein
VLHITCRIATRIRSCLPFNRLGDQIYSTLLFLECHERLPNNSLMFNDVLFHMKISDEIKDPLRVFVSDKEFVKLYVKSIVGDEYNVPTIDIVRSVEAIDDYVFPSDCCIKPTHASGEVIIRKNGDQIDRNRIKRWFEINYYRLHREANYKTLKPKVIIEQVMFAKSNLDDYKFFCFNGVPKLIQVDIDRYMDHKRMFFDISWNELDFSITYPKADKQVNKPKNFFEMLDVATRLSAGFGFVRVDLYTNGMRCVVGEITNCHGAANERFIPKLGERKASDIIFTKQTLPQPLQSTAARTPLMSRRF